MDAKLKKKWVKALLSGKYRQGEGMLQDGGKYCCLGVLGYVANFPYDGSAGELIDLNGNAKFLPMKFQEELANLNDTSGEVVDLPDGDIELEEPVPFEMIAGLIDQAL